ncbi:MAG: hypothetical protein P8P81_02860 [Bacteroidia bacterium]|nr:hypothetical protein [Bacteroidia bacterium]
MKNTPKLMIALAVLGIASAANAQTWNLNGNYTTPMDRLGSINAEDLTFVTDNVPRMSLTKNGFLGLGTNMPNGHQEITYCPPTLPIRIWSHCHPKQV